jgi:hypothetical protein
MGKAFIKYNAFFENLNVPTELFGLAVNGQGLLAGLE